MTTINGTITNANPGPALYAVIETAMLADGWTLVDTVVIGGNTHKVLKSAAAGNSQNLDWYLDINYPTTGTTGGIRFAPFEVYNATTHVATRGPYAASNTSIDATTYSPLGATSSALETNWTNSATYTNLSNALTTGAFNYRISVTRNRIIALLTNNASQIAYAGFFNPNSAHTSYAGSALFPLIMGVFTANANHSSAAAASTVAMTRLPKLGSMTAGAGWFYYCSVMAAIANMGAASEGVIGASTSPFTGRMTGIPLPVTVAVGGSPSQITTPSASDQILDTIGTLDDVVAASVVSTSVRDDSFVDSSSNVWYGVTPVGPSAGLFFKGI